MARTSSVIKSHLVHILAPPPPPPPRKKKSKTNLPQKIFLIFPEVELSSSNMKNILIFSQKKAFLIFSQKIKIIHPVRISYASGNDNTKKTSYIFSKESCFYISGNGNSKKAFYISGGNLQGLKIKNILYFSL